MVVFLMFETYFILEKHFSVEKLEKLTKIILFFFGCCLNPSYLLIFLYSVLLQGDLQRPSKSYGVAQKFTEFVLYVVPKEYPNRWTPHSSVTNQKTMFDVGSFQVNCFIFHYF